VLAGTEAPRAEEAARTAEFVAEAKAAHEKFVAERPERYEQLFGRMVNLLESIAGSLGRR
jgi:hypothetical protein